MNKYHKQQKLRKRKGIFRKWHRRLGFAASVFLLNLAITGVLLNHYESFGLHLNHIKSAWLLDIYGVKAPKQAVCFTSKQMTACQLDHQLYINQLFFNEEEGKLLGVLQHANFYFAITTHHLYVFTENWELAEKISYLDDLESNIVAAAYTNGLLAVNTGKSDFIMELSSFEWQPPEEIKQLKLNHFEPTPLTESSLVSLQDNYKARQITQLRFVQDLHSGRLLGLSGQLFNDITAVIIILLAISGFITWQRRKKIAN
ncbi:PepSY-associated TM helix domain-containing protein [Aliikangiella sp. IMCC44359]|uniref:PepSY-associated TM helix domain-containing protein n=1 Tax=Aliikangiella sp. IMCC44359 TaxID=3459125 RepID=UPI00403A8038